MLLSTALLFNACNNSKPAAGAGETAFIRPPIPGLETKGETFQVDAAKGGVFTSRNGSTVTVPAGALTDANGKPLTGNVDFVLREINDAASIYLSGIPMAYDTAGMKKTLETAGMFEIRASQGGNAVAIKSGSPIKIRYASFADGQDYNNYYLDQEKRNWAYTGYSKAVVNKDKEKVKSKIASMTPSLSFPLSKQHFVLRF